MRNPIRKNASLLFFRAKPTEEVQQLTPSEYIIRVDRSDEPLYYPDRMKPVYRDLKPGPSEYHLIRVKTWLHKRQEDGLTARGHVIYSYLREKNELHNHLGYFDLLKIQEKGVDVFQKFFPIDRIGAFGWRSIAQYPNGNIGVPYLSVSGKNLNLSWFPLTYIWYSHNPALVFSK